MNCAADPTDSSGPVEALADGIMATVRTARALAEARRRVDLAGLNDMVGVLCARVLDLPLNEGRQLRGRLEAIDHEIALLEQALPTA